MKLMIMKGSIVMYKLKKIGIDFHTFDGIYQGSRSHILGLFSEAIKLNSQFEFIFFLDKPEKLLQQYPVFSEPNVRLVRMKHRSGLFRFLFQLPYLQLRYKLDLLHTQYRLPLITFGACACTIHDLLFEDFPEYFKPSFVKQSKITFKLAAKKAKLLFSVSNYSKSRICDLYNVDPNKITVLYNGVDRQRFFPGNDGSEHLLKFNLTSKGYILTVGRLEPRKNHTRLIKAYAMLKEKNIPLVIVGQKDFEYQPILDLIHDLSLIDKIIILENIDDVVLPILMRHAKVFVFPAIAEGFGMPVLEALASGIPVITSNTTALAEVAGNAAIQIDPTNVDEIYHAIDQLLNIKNIGLQIVKNASNQVMKFNWLNSAEMLLSIYNQYFFRKNSNNE